jgi:hypothetical protein
MNIEFSVFWLEAVLVSSKGMTDQDLAFRPPETKIAQMHQNAMIRTASHKIVADISAGVPNHRHLADRAQSPVRCPVY